MKRKIILLLLVLVGLVLLTPATVFADECVWVQLRNGDIVRLDRSKTFETSGQTYYRGCGLTFDNYPADDVNFYGSVPVGQATADIYCVGTKIPVGSTFVITKERQGRAYIWWKEYERDCPTPDYVIIDSIFLNQIWGYDSSIVSSEQPEVTATPFSPAPPTLTPVSPTKTPMPTTTLVPATSTPVPTATKKPLSATTPVVSVASSEPVSSPQGKSTGGNPRDELGRLCWGFFWFVLAILLLVGLGKLGIVWWRHSEARRKEEEVKKKEQFEEARKKFDRYVAKARNALRYDRLDEVKEAIRNADAVREAHPNGAEIVQQLNAQLKEKKLKNN